MFKNLKSGFLVFILGLLICFNSISPALAGSYDDLFENNIRKNGTCVDYKAFPYETLAKETFSLPGTSFKKTIEVSNVHVHQNSYETIECHPHINVKVTPVGSGRDDLNYHIWAEKSKKGRGCIVVWESRYDKKTQVCDETKDIYATAKELATNIAKEIADKLDDIKWTAVYAMIGTAIIEAIKDLWWVIVLA